jgi:hypothetical protein
VVDYIEENGLYQDESANSISNTTTDKAVAHPTPKKDGIS